MRTTPKLSVCLTTYNRAGYLREAIQSVLEQTFTDYELIISDNGSTDETEQVVRSFHDNRIIYLRHPHNLGAFANAESAYHRARGQYIKLFHDDDIMLPDHLARAVKILDDNPRVGLVHCRVKHIDDEGKEIEWPPFPDHQADFLVAGRHYFERLIFQGNPVYCPSVVTRRECFERLGFLDKSLDYAYDLEMWLRICLFYDVYYLAAPDFKYREHKSNVHNYYGDNVLHVFEAWKAGELAINKFPEQVPDRRALLKRLSHKWAFDALERAHVRCTNRMDANARQHVIFALRICPTCCVSALFLKVLCRLVLGGKTVIRARRILHRGGRSAGVTFDT